MELPSVGRLWLAYGITELRDMADNAYRAAEEREAFGAGAAVGPRLFPTGEAVNGERVYYSMMIPTANKAQLVRWLSCKSIQGRRDIDVCF
jgi:hypothetical protein